jgi:hypothetical protein
MTDVIRSSPSQKPELERQPGELHGTEEHMLTEYLLGELPTGQREAFEYALFSDPSLYHKLLMAEDKLIDDYLGNRLSDRQQRRFVENFLISERRREKLAIGQTFLIALSDFTDYPRASGKSFWRVPIMICGYLTIAFLVISFLFIAAYFAWRT